MEFRIRRTVSFEEHAFIEADNFDELKEKMKDEEINWNVDIDDVVIEDAIVEDDEGEQYDLPDDILEEDFISIVNGCIIFNNESFNNTYLSDF